MTAPTFPGTKRTDPPEGSAPSERDPISARAVITSTAEARRRELVGEIRETSAKLRRLLNEHAMLGAHLELAGVVPEEGE